MFNNWKKYLDRDIELRALELSGRGKRIYDPLYENIEEAVEDVYKMIDHELNLAPFGFFGHSMGCIIAYELAQKLRKMGRHAPSFVFFAGRGAPHMPRPEDKELCHTLPQDEFKEKILEMGGTSPEFFEHEELLQVLMPMLRQDFQIAETYSGSGEIHPLDYDINVMIGKEEDITAELAHGWKDHTRKMCTLYYIEGGHFFLNENTQRVVDIVNRTVRRVTGR